MNTFDNDLPVVGGGTTVDHGLSRRQRRKLARACRSRKFSANLVVDLQNTTQMIVSIQDSPLLSGGITANASGTIIGQSCDMVNADTYTNLFAGGVSASGQVRLQVQCAPADTSGLYTDPTSGMSAFPGAFASGGILWINSGGTGGGILGGFVSGQAIASGFFVAQGFIRNGRYARVNVLTEGTSQYAGALVAGFIGNLHTTGSGGGYSFSPGSGVVNV